MYFLTINAGSSSIKFSIFDAQTLAEDYTGTLSGIGFDAASFTVSGARETSHELVASNHAEATQFIQQWITRHISSESIVGVGYRIVHGGPRYGESCLLSDDILAELRDIVPLDPEHLPVQLAIAEQMMRAFSSAKHIACFDTAFFNELPTNARLLPLPRKLEAEGVRRYGFHGLSYSYLLQELERQVGSEIAHGKVVMAHLGNGASLAALSDGKPVDTSMGMTPAGGVPMSARSGDLDPGVLTYLVAQKGYSMEQLDRMIGFESGLVGISETTSDMKKLLAIEHDDARAQDAVEIFCYQVRKYIGAYAAALGGLDCLVFSGGIGEASAPVRARVCKDLAFLGIELDESRNQASREVISTDDSQVAVYVIPTNEALMIARDMKQMLNHKTE